MHKVQRTLTRMHASHATFSEMARTPRSVVTRACRGLWVHPKYIARMIRASGNRLKLEDFGPRDPFRGRVAKMGDSNGHNRTTR